MNRPKRRFFMRLRLIGTSLTAIGICEVQDMSERECTTSLVRSIHAYMVMADWPLSYAELKTAFDTDDLSLVSALVELHFSRKIERVRLTPNLVYYESLGAGNE